MPALMIPSSKPCVLLLAGVAEAREVAEQLAALGRWRVVASLSGATEAPVDLPCDMRRGGFGGIGGMIETLKWGRIDAIIDATHPFAARISANAEAAAGALGLPRVLLRRPGWTPGRGDDWREVADLSAAADYLPPSARAFLATGRRSLRVFGGRADVWFLARVIDPPAAGFPLPCGDYVVGRPPFTPADEAALMRNARITHLVAKNSGGAGGEAKLAAARALGLPVVMVARPAPPPGPVVGTAAAAVAWLAGLTVAEKR